jgi:hypothetical protein
MASKQSSLFDDEYAVTDVEQPVASPEQQQPVRKVHQFIVAAIDVEFGEVTADVYYIPIDVLGDADGKTVTRDELVRRMFNVLQNSSIVQLKFWGLTRDYKDRAEAGYAAPHDVEVQRVFFVRSN